MAEVCHDECLSALIHYFAGVDWNFQPASPLFFTCTYHSMAEKDEWDS